MHLQANLFWLSLSVLVYTYLGYGVLMYIIISLKKWIATPKAVPTATSLPAVTLIIPVYNEEIFLAARIENCLQINYPKEKLHFIFITDGSTDASNNMMNRYGQHEQISHLYQPLRKGKMAAVNRAMHFVHTPIVVFSDANTFLNTDCINHIVNHYADEQVGGVAGEKRVGYFNAVKPGFGEGLYWCYESLLKQIDSDLNTVVGAAGELFSMRTDLFHAQNEAVILDDLTLSMDICLQGYKVVYEPKAFSIEAPSINIKEEGIRRVRIASGAFQYLFGYSDFATMFQQPLLAFQYISRRVFRWLFCPPALISLLLTNGWLYIHEPAPFYTALLFIQITFYLLAFAGYLLNQLGRSPAIFYLPFYFVFMHFTLVKGFVRYITGKQTVTWEKSKRNTMEYMSGSL